MQIFKDVMLDRATKIRSSKVIVDFENIERLGEFWDNIFVMGVQSFHGENNTEMCIVAFNNETFLRAVQYWHELKKDDPYNERIVAITRLEKYNPVAEEMSFIEKLPNLEIFKAVDFTFLINN